MNSATFKWIAAHAAGFGSLAFAVGYAMAGDLPQAGMALLTAAAAFGLNIKPAAQPKS